MAARSTRPALVVVVGPTTSGKSKLAIDIARESVGEVISADSRSIYKDMDLGTAKPRLSERPGIVHWGFDLVEPGQTFSAARFQKYAQAKIKDITKRGKLPILVGGTGLYVDSVVFDFGFRQPAKTGLRQKLEMMTAEELRFIIAESGFKMPENFHNRRHLIRVIESAGQVVSRQNQPLPGSLIIGINPGNWLLKRRIKQRAKANLDGIIRETQSLVKKYGQDKLSQNAGIPYLAALDYLAGKIDKKSVLKKIQTAEWQYARRQRTWFKRNLYIRWFSSADAAFKAFKSGRIK